MRSMPTGILWRIGGVTAIARLRSDAALWDSCSSMPSRAPMPPRFGPEGNGWIQTGLPAGRYCDVIHSNLATDKTRCLTENGQEVMPVTVYPDGKAHIPVQPMDAVALHSEPGCSADSWARTRATSMGR